MDAVECDDLDDGGGSDKGPVEGDLLVVFFQWGR